MISQDLSYQRGYWKNFAKTSKKDDLSRDLHSSWSDSTQSYEEATEISEALLEEIKGSTKMLKVLDFGVGMGRNYDYLGVIFSKVYGFDTEEMIGRLKDHKPEVRNVTHHLSSIFSRDYDVVYESVSMQHMPPQEVIQYLNLISSHSKYFYSWTRSYNDFLRNFTKREGGVNLFTLIKSLNLFELVDCSIDVEDASRKMDETHYEVLYKCKNYTEEPQKVLISSDGGVNLH